MGLEMRPSVRVVGVDNAASYVEACVQEIVVETVVLQYLRQRLGLEPGEAPGGVVGLEHASAPGHASWLC
jgi:hypothetical protein